MRVIIEKHERRMTVFEGEREVFRCRVALGCEPEGPKQREGDGRTPEGVYTICLVKERGKYGRSLGLSYPGIRDAQEALLRGEIDRDTFLAVDKAHQEGRRPPWGSPLGGEIYIHEGGSQCDWTQGCIALDASDMDRLFPLRDRLEAVEIRP